ncbi:cyclic-phosphate processing receiver domain-containing protein [Roseateles amylovorans]|uniref:Cyclic-phosphate processing Receiver domain-containing protein n=1 Tax=Roseateles amylovorans TaxID=2978473 RepID=A0ABY6B5G6_9BURK|nr:cyclic-phosphate processing receiver domain-containing protein [Roseateles amylovorans]UXH79991.1 hypothetical protein N4261_08965 [Roseateles amylovorans]
MLSAKEVEHIQDLILMDEGGLAGTHGMGPLEGSDPSLDHDLGDDQRGTGYDVVLWIEEEVALNGFDPPRIKVHSANSSARAKMEAGIRSIERLMANQRSL